MILIVDQTLMLRILHGANAWVAPLPILHGANAGATDSPLVT